MSIKFYSLLYYSSTEVRRVNRRNYSQLERFDLYVKSVLLLNNSLMSNGFSDGVTVLTNDSAIVREACKRINVSTKEPDIIEIPFNLNVPPNIPFYSAHFKVDVFKYFATLPNTQYSILMDSDVICLNNFNNEFLSIIDEGIPSVYYLPNYHSIKKIKSVQKIDKSINWMPWVGGEYIGGNGDFYLKLYNEIMLIKESYWKEIEKGLFHVGDEFLTSLALFRLRKTITPIDVTLFGVIYRYWSIFEKKSLWSYNTSFIHLPGDKIFFSKVSITSKSVKDIMRWYKLYKFLTRLKFKISRLL